ncbi:hypothetical protein FQR65_LT08850 [Abscondita terminalis]|nr:hypothetical protein FQR65_LT08850 [Abscondita terminalis]
MHVCIHLVTLLLCAVIVLCGPISCEEKSQQQLMKNESKILRRLVLNTDNFTNETRLTSSRKLKGKGKKKKKHKQDLLSRILPMLIIPFLLQTAIIPMILTALKFMLLKSAFIGKIAILLGIINMVMKKMNHGGLYTHNLNLGRNPVDEEVLMEEHYGYNGVGGSEYGAYINRRKRNS